MGYRKTSDPTVKTRLCDECRAVIVGIQDHGFTYWVDVTPCTREMEVLYQRAGRATYLVQPRAGRTAWINPRPPYLGGKAPTRGIILVEHPHQKPGPMKVPDPPWVMDMLVTRAPTDPERMLF